MFSSSWVRRRFGAGAALPGRRRYPCVVYMAGTVASQFKLPASSVQLVLHHSPLVSPIPSSLLPALSRETSKRAMDVRVPARRLVYTIGAVLVLGAFLLFQFRLSSDSAAAERPVRSPQWAAASDIRNSTLGVSVLPVVVLCRSTNRDTNPSCSLKRYSSSACRRGRTVATAWFCRPPSATCRSSSSTASWAKTSPRRPSPWPRQKANVLPTPP